MSPKSHQTPFDSPPSKSAKSPASGSVIGSGRALQDHPDTMPATTAIIIRRLSPGDTVETLKAMLTFTKHCIGAEFVDSSPEDVPYLTAVAKFLSLPAATEARDMLDGKTNCDNSASMGVDVLSRPYPWSTREGRASDSLPGQPDGSHVSKAPSKFSSAFQPLERISPPQMSPNGMKLIDGTSPTFQASTFSPTSPIGPPLERQRVSGRSVIEEDGVDDETGQILHDPVAFARNDSSGSGYSSGSRRNTADSSQQQQHLFSRMGALSINSNVSNMTSSPASGTMTQHSMQSPATPFTPPGMIYSPRTQNSFSPWSMTPQHTYPPINPADQNSPCNTLYVGNLPQDTSEDELKAIFSKQRGYKRLCFRTKQNGPMCFVEFEDVTCAGKALSELYGHPLHNSLKGGIRLSFSKNPLGVRRSDSQHVCSPPIGYPNALYCAWTKGPGDMNGLAGASAGPGGLQQAPATVPFSFVGAQGHVNLPGLGGFVNQHMQAPPGLAGPPGLTSGSSYHQGPQQGFRAPVAPIGNHFAAAGASYGWHS